MEEYYRKEDVLKCFDPVPTKAPNATGMRIPTTSEVQFKVMVLPVKKMPRGKWVKNERGRYACNICNCEAQVIRSPFCPNCGAMMDGE